MWADPRAGIAAVASALFELWYEAEKRIGHTSRA